MPTHAVLSQRLLDYDVTVLGHVLVGLREASPLELDLPYSFLKVEELNEIQANIMLLVLEGIDRLLQLDEAID